MGKYLYCVIKKSSPVKFKIKGIDNGEIYTINEGKLSAVVSDVEIKEYLPIRENLVGHQKVIEGILKKYTLLPISFGIVAQSSDEVKELLRKNREKIFKTLKGVENKIEFGLKVFWQNMPAIFEEIVKENKEIQRAKALGSVGMKTMLAVGEMTAKALERKKIKEAALILQPLLKIAQEIKEGELLRDDMLLNANFLVNRSKEKDFDLAINQLDEKYGRRVKFKYIGPVPPSNFINLHLKM